MSATVTPAAATGSVTFFDGSTPIGAAVIHSGVATYPTRVLPAGSRTLKAVYAGDSTYSGSTSANVTVTVTAVNARGLINASDRSSSVYELAEGDFNGDGNLDIAVIPTYDFGVPWTLKIYLGNGDGTFQAGATYTVGGFSRDIVAGDFNGDGATDLAVTSSDAGGTVSVLLGRGDGTFTGPVFYNFASTVRTIATGDFNGDGKADLAVTTDQSTGVNAAIKILLGNGDGTFQTPLTSQTLAETCFYYRVAVGDFNRDGKTDIAALDGCNGNLHILLGNGNGTLQGPLSYFAGVNTYSLAAVDLNADGKLDLAITFYNAGGHLAAIYMGNGDGTFQTPNHIWDGSVSCTAISFGDFNADGKIDLVFNVSAALINGTSQPAIVILFGNGDGTFQQYPKRYPSGSPTSKLAVGDFNGDGIPDVIQASDIASGLSVMLGVPLPPGDFDGNGFPEVVWRNTTGTNVIWYMGGTDGAYFLSGKQLTGDSSTWRVVALADLNGDGKPDLLWQNTSGTVVVWYMGGADGSVYQSAKQLSADTSTWKLIAAADLDGNGKADLIWQSTSGTVVVWYMGGADGSTYLSAKQLAADSATWRLAAVADVNGDGKPDLLWQNTGGTVVVWYMGGSDSSVFKSGKQLAGNSATLKLIAAVDVDGNGFADLIFQTTGGSVQTWFMGGSDGSTFLYLRVLSGDTPYWTLVGL